MQVLKLPKSGKAMEEGTVTEWRVDEGDAVSEGDTVVVVEADKSAVEVTAEREGVLLDVSVPEGETVPVGTELGRIGSPTEADGAADAGGTDATTGTDSGGDGDADGGPAETTAGTTSAVTRRDSASGGADTDAASRDSGAGADARGAEDDGPVRATPTARRIARERGVSLDDVMASVADGVSVRPEHVEAFDGDAERSDGVDAADAADAVDAEILGSPYARVVAAERGVSIAAVGETLGTDRVREAHVERYVEEYGTDGASGAGADATPVSAAASADESAPAEETSTDEAEATDGPAVREERSLDGAAGVMYDRMGRVAREYASTTTVQKVDVTDLMDLYDRVAPAWDREGDSLSLTAFVVRAVARALPEYPELNAEHAGERELRVFEDVNVGIAVDSDRGLVVPTVFDADERTLRDLTAEIERLAGRARSGELGPDEMADGTFTVSNAGSLGAYMNTPQINPPQTGILGVCEVFDEPDIVDGEVVPREKMHLCLTYDHRVIDGATAVGFVSDVADALERPESLLS